MTRNVKNEKKKINPVRWLFAVIIPLLIVIVIIVVLLHFSGYSVVDWTKEKASELPVISNFVTSPEEDALEEENSRLLEELETQTEELEQMEAYIADLETTIDQMEEEAAEKESEEDLGNPIDDSTELEDESVVQGIDKSLKEMAKTFEEMKASGAAAILANMDKDEIVLILRELPSDARGDILEAMEAGLAASLAAELLN